MARIEAAVLRAALQRGRLDARQLTTCPGRGVADVTATAAARAGGELARIEAAVAVTSATPRRICDRITPELPRAPFSAPVDSAAATPG
ncbi:hypothetical protein MAHJHV35_48350 [Mycobacterium avium subsp. hominissuis]